MFNWNKTKKQLGLENSKLELQQDKFQSIMQFAQSVLDNTRGRDVYKQYYSKGNEHPILDVVRLVGKTIQAKYLTSLLYYNDETELPAALPGGQLFFDIVQAYTYDGKRMNQLKKEEKNTKEIRLEKELIVPWPWKRERLINTISYIGENRKWGQWRQDFNNHFIELWLPLGIAWVKGGNHSIAIGIVQGTGSIKPESTYNISELYNHILDRLKIFKGFLIAKNIL